jgi:hydrogenase maturation protease
VKHDIHVKAASETSSQPLLHHHPISGEPKVPGTLIIGYGNALRGDDAVGLHAAHELESQFRDDPDVEVISSHQLTPELADDISDCELVIFLDASCDGKAGTVLCRPISLESGHGAFTHQLDPASLIAAAEQLYGEAPKAFSLTLTGWSFEVGNKLSRGAKLQLPELVSRARELVASHRKQLTAAAATSRLR